MSRSQTLFKCLIRCPELQVVSRSCSCVENTAAAAASSASSLPSSDCKPRGTRTCTLSTICSVDDASADMLVPVQTAHPPFPMLPSTDLYRNGADVSEYEKFACRAALLASCKEVTLPQQQSPTFLQQKIVAEAVAPEPIERVKEKMVSLCKKSSPEKEQGSHNTPCSESIILAPNPQSTEQPPAPGTTTSFYRRELPSELVSFTSAEGRKLFKEALNAGFAEGYFNLAGNFTVQSEPAYCGPSSLAMVLNALEVDPGRTWKGVWRWYSDELLESCRTESELKASGITFDQFLCLSSSYAQVIAKRGAAATREEFLRDIKYVTQRDDVFMVLSFSRQALGQTGDGHFSPIGAYHPATNKALVLDSARYKYPSWFGDVDKLYDSLQPVDIETSLPRGYFLISRKDTRLDPTLLATDSHLDQLSVSDIGIVDLPERPLDVFPTKLSCGKSKTCCSSKQK